MTRNTRIRKIIIIMNCESITLRIRFCVAFNLLAFVPVCLLFCFSRFCSSCHCVSFIYFYTLRLFSFLLLLHCVKCLCLSHLDSIHFGAGCQHGFYVELISKPIDFEANCLLRKVNHRKKYFLC